MKIAIIAQPRSGSTLLLRLLNLSCKIHCVGDRPPGVYQAAYHLHEAMNDGRYKMTYKNEMLRDSEFCDAYCGYYSSGSMKLGMRSIIDDMLGRRIDFATTEAFKTTVMWWNPEVNAEKFIDMLRDLYDDIKIVWLIRDSRDIANSFITTEGTGLYGKHDHEDLIIECANRQRDAFDKNREIMDSFVTYSRLCENPKEILKEIGAKDISEAELTKVMSKKIRS